MKKLLLVLVIVLMSTVAFSYEIATIYSDYAESKYKNELTDPLTIGGNIVTPYLNTEVDKLVENLDKYRVIIGCSLYNYSKPVDFSPYKDAFYNYVNNGGIMIFTDVNYPDHAKVISDLFPGYYYLAGKTYEEPNGLGIILQKDSPFFKYINAMNCGWGGCDKVSDNFTPLVVDREMKPTLVYAKIGKGMIFASSMFQWFPNSPFISNILQYDGKEKIDKLSDKFSYENKYKLNIPKTINVGKTSIKLNEKVPSFKVYVEDKTYVSKNGICPIDFDKAGKYTLMATIYDKNGDILGYTKSIDIEVVDYFDLDIVYPYYRDIVQSKDPDKTFIAKIKFHNDKIKTASVTWTLKQGTKIIKTETKNIAQNISFNYDLSKLPEGEYSYNFTLKSNEKILRNIDKSFKVLAPAPYEVTFDRKKVCYVNGEPYLPIMLYHTGSACADYANVLKKPEAPEIKFDDIISGMKERGFNAGNSTVLKESDIIKFSENNMTYFGEVGRKADPKKMDEFVETYNKVNAGLIYYTYDEPIGEGVYIAKQEYDYLREKDPHRPVGAAVCVPGVFKTANEVHDIMMPDPYPVTGANKTPSYSCLLDFIKPAMEVCNYKKPLWAVPQGFGFKTRPEWSVPTPEQAYCQAWFYLVYGVTGFCWYAYHTGEKDEAMMYNCYCIVEHKELWDSFKTLNKELQDFFPIIVKGERAGALKCDNNLIHSNIWTCEGKNYAVIVNPEPSDQKATFDVKGSVLPYFDGKSYSMSQNGDKLTVNFKPYEAIVVKY